MLLISRQKRHAHSHRQCLFISLPVSPPCQIPISNLYSDSESHLLWALRREPPSKNVYNMYNIFPTQLFNSLVFVNYDVSIHPVCCRKIVRVEGVIRTWRRVKEKLNLHTFLSHVICPIPHWLNITLTLINSTRKRKWSICILLYANFPYVSPFVSFALLVYNIIVSIVAFTIYSTQYGVQSTVQRKSRKRK